MIHTSTASSESRLKAPPITDWPSGHSEEPCNDTIASMIINIAMISVSPSLRKIVIFTVTATAHLGHVLGDVLAPVRGDGPVILLATGEMKTRIDL